MTHALVQGLGTALVPYLLLLVVPLMGRMSDPDANVRQLASAAFAPAVALLPLAQVRNCFSNFSRSIVCRVQAACDALCWAGLQAHSCTSKFTCCSSSAVV